VTGPFANPTRRSLLLRLAGTGFLLAKYLKRSGIGMKNAIVHGHVQDILSTQERLAPGEPQKKPSDIADFDLV
jgi:hypothetical protein